MKAKFSKHGYEILFLSGIVLAVVLRLVYIGGYGYETDIGARGMWAKTVKESGIHSFYSSGADYPPLIAYMLYLLPSGTVAELKLPAVFADILISLIIFLVLRKRSVGIAAASSLLFALNPAVIYNSAIWGQNDSILALFLVLSLAAFSYKRIELSWVFFTLGVLFKAQALAFGPLLLYATYRNHRQELPKPLLLSLVVIAVVTLPFIVSGNIDKVLNIYLSAAEQYPYTSMNAYNLWWLVFLGNSVSDAQQFLFLPYRLIGLLLFGAVYITLLLRTKKFDIYNTFLAASLVSLAFFMLPTQMHERYMFNLFAFMPFVLFGKKVGLTKNLLLFAALSFTYLANMAIVLGSVFPQHNPWQFITTHLSRYTVEIALLNVMIFAYMVYDFCTASDKVNDTLKKIRDVA